MSMRGFLEIALQVILFLALAPLLSGLIAKFKNFLRMRKGASIFQPYYNLRKLFWKSEVVSEHASWIFLVTPFVVLASALSAAVFVPVFTGSFFAQSAGDLLLLVFILAAGRFFLCLAGLDAASSFGGMGSSREVFISSIAEPVAILAILALSVHFGTTNPALFSLGEQLHFSPLIASAALLLVILAETSRLPVDNQETHLELTMIHEAMVLEYSGRSLALLELASYIKQLIWFSLLGYILFPVAISLSGSVSALAIYFLLYLFKLVMIGALVSVIEVSLAKMRLFRAIDFFTFAFAMALMALVSAIIGV